MHDQLDEEKIEPELIEELHCLRNEYLSALAKGRKNELKEAFDAWPAKAKANAKGGAIGCHFANLRGGEYRYTVEGYEAFGVAIQFVDKFKKMGFRIEIMSSGACWIKWG